jgi:hypothetical protein
VWLWPYGRRRALVFAAALVGTFGVIGVVINAATVGSFWFNVVTANVNAYDWGLLAWYAEDVVRTVPVLLTGLVASVVLLVRERRSSARIVVPYAVAALVVALTAGKSGSSLNYLVELGTACCLAAGFLLADLRSRPRWRVAALAALLVQTLGLAGFPYPYYADLLHAAGDRGTAEQIAAAVATSPGPVLADEDSGYLPLRNRPIDLQPFELSQLSYGGLWDQQPLLTSIRQHRYAVILVYETDQTPSAEEYRWTPEMLAAIRQSYLIDARIERPLGRTVVYRPAR